ncbi:RCC1 domain-containing protein [Pseudomonas sp. 210_17 TE3656]
MAYLEWTDNRGNTYKPEGRTISGSMVGKPVVFTVPYAELEKNENNTVTVICRVEPFEGTELRTRALSFAVTESAAPALPAPTVAEANAEGVIDPNTVTAGATVVIGSEAGLLPGDKVRVVLSGKAGDDQTHTVMTAGVQRFKVGYAVILANKNSSIELQYHVQRGGSGPAEPSPPAEYDVRVIIGGGRLRILGARFNRSTYRSSGSPRYLQAFHAVSGQPLVAEWKYSTDPQWAVASRWPDVQPHLPLQVRTNDDQVTLNPANIIGSGADTTLTGTAAFIAHRDDGRVRGWGNAAFGASIDPTIRTLNDIVEVSCTTSAYAIRRVGGIVTVWGNAANGGNMGAVSPNSFTTVVANGVAFAGIKTSGQVVAWGVAASGGTVPAPISAYTDIVKVVGASTAFAALRATGHVVAWGAATLGGKVPGPIAALADIDDIKGNFKAFAARRRNGTVVAWGDPAYGGNATPVADYTDIVEICSANAGAFVVKRASGHIVAWGSPTHGGTLPVGIAGLTDIIDVASNWHVFAAVRANGSVVAWGGTAAEGGVVPDAIADLTNVVQVTGSSKAFAVLCRDGTVKAWGDKTVGGDITPVLADLVDVQAVYSNTHGFVALRRDGRVVTWGHALGGGDSSAVRGQLDGFVTYRASSATRGRALSAQRTISAAGVVG